MVIQKLSKLFSVGDFKLTRCENITLYLRQKKIKKKLHKHQVKKEKLLKSVSVVLTTMGLAKYQFLT